MEKFVMALDQGTTSTRCIIFDSLGRVRSLDQKEHTQYYPKPGWVEHDPIEILESTKQVITGALSKSEISEKQISAIGITNQRETTVMWDRLSGKPVCNAIVWQDTRTDKICRELSRDTGIDRFRNKVGLPLATYFSGPKIRWILENHRDIQQKAQTGELCFGTIDTWLIWNLTGGTREGIHVTDLSNASRTMLMDLGTLEWSTEMLHAFDLPGSILPRIMPSSMVYGETRIVAPGIPISSILGDQQAALFGQTCFSPGEAKNTYGTGCFMLLNTGEKPIISRNGLLTTVGYKLGDQPAIYCLEGSIAITGALVQWIRDNLGLIQSSSEIETLAMSVEDNGGVYFVPAFSGLFAPYWRSDARGIIIGLTRYANRAHIARAALEATAYQTREVVDAMENDSRIKLTTLKVDGGMVCNNLLMQFQSDILNVPVIRPKVSETTALGAAYAAGLAVGYWKSIDELRSKWTGEQTWHPKMPQSQRDSLLKNWKKAVTHTFNWKEDE